MTALVVPSEDARCDPLACPTFHSGRKILPTMPVPSGFSGSFLTVYDRGGMARVRVGPPPPDRVRKPPAKPLKQDAAQDEGALVPTGTTATKKPIVGLSKKSLMALRECLARLNADAFALLITLTWPDWAAPEGRTFREPWSRLRKRMAHTWPAIGGVYRVELTRKGVVHIHAIAYGIPADRKTIKAFREWVAVAWSECVRADHQERRREVGTTVEVPKQGRAVTRYISKYMSKPETPVDLRIGRWWDTWNDAALPTLDPSRIPVTDDEARTIKTLMDVRVQVSYMARRMRQGAPEPEAEAGWLTIPRPAHTRRVLTDDPSEWHEYLEALRGGVSPAVLMERVRSEAWEVQHRHTERMERKRANAARRQPSQVTPVGGSRRVRVGVAGAVAPPITAVGSTVQTQGI